MSFMETGTANHSADGINERKTLNWPYHPHKIWVEKGNILIVLPEPQQAASSSRRKENVYRLDSSTVPVIMRVLETQK